MSRITTDQLRDAVLDEDSFISWDTPPLEVPISESYARDLADVRAATGRDESVLTGEGRVLGRRVAVVACEFDFLAGSIGVAAAERITAAMERATSQRLPLLASPSSGGTRMQEGTVASLQMVKIAAAVRLHKQAHLPYLVYLRHPTTGGVFASWGSLGHVTVAEPGP
ncbi:carboxyl transferase domain protein [Mycobacterium ulcerans str. Harvey]|uniref:Carboxyl transferase domain protein n=1 Tax=Mycobacterium ulcerans str. Harvey TaxID=1299332 RepID=A0ABP3ATA0_MYCUL|nr:carboxyl transferase domain protein [Mycobacterium ulcerans str. Harvey]